MGQVAGLLLDSVSHPVCSSGEFYAAMAVGISIAFGMLSGISNISSSGAHPPRIVHRLCPEFPVRLGSDPTVGVLAAVPFYFTGDAALQCL